MPYGINVKCLNDTARNIAKLWDEASFFETLPSMRALNYPPHFSLAVYEDVPEDIDHILSDVFAHQPKLKISFEEVGYFDNDNLVLWARPLQTDALLELHTKLHSKIKSERCLEYYQPGNWVPHCTLATRVPLHVKEAALEWAKQERQRYEVIFDFADIVSAPPLRIESEFRLT